MAQVFAFTIELNPQDMSRAHLDIVLKVASWRAATAITGMPYDECWRIDASPLAVDETREMMLPGEFPCIDRITLTRVE